MGVQISVQVFLHGGAHVSLLVLFFLGVGSLKIFVFSSVRALQLFLVYWNAQVYFFYGTLKRTHFLS